MQLLHELCCFDFISDIPSSPATVHFKVLCSIYDSYSLIQKCSLIKPSRVSTVKLFTPVFNFSAIRFYNEADKPESSSILTYSGLMTGLDS
jgi:hypothetical protein